MMKIYKHESLTDFEFGSGAKDKVKYLTGNELEQIEENLLNLYPDGIHKTDLNNFFWLEDDLIAEWLGYDNFEAIMTRSDDEFGGTLTGNEDIFN